MASNLINKKKKVFMGKFFTRLFCKLESIKINLSLKF